jgi:hypothetical protein
VKLDESTRRFAWELEMGYVRIYADTGEGHAALDSILFVGAGSNEVELELPRD